MHSLEKEYQELVNLTKEYVLQEHSLNEYLLINNSTFHHFDHLRKNNSPTQPNTKNPIIRSDVKPPTKATPSIPVPAQPIKPTPAQSSLPATPPPALEKQTIQMNTQPKVLGALTLETTPATPITDFQVMRTLVKEHFPNLQILDSPPSDAKAITANNNWKTNTQDPNILIVLKDEAAKSRQLADNICKTLQIYKKKALIILETAAGPKDFGNQELKLVITSTNSHSISEFNFGNAPVIYFDITQCLTEPQRKADLWSILKKTILS